MPADHRGAACGNRTHDLFTTSSVRLARRNVSQRGPCVMRGCRKGRRARRRRDWGHHGGSRHRRGSSGRSRRRSDSGAKAARRSGRVKGGRRPSRSDAQGPLTRTEAGARWSSGVGGDWGPGRSPPRTARRRRAQAGAGGAGALIFIEANSATSSPRHRPAPPSAPTDPPGSAELSASRAGGDQEPAGGVTFSSEVGETAAGRKPRAIIQTPSTISCTARGMTKRVCSVELAPMTAYIASR